jgi:hypothetical protein
VVKLHRDNRLDLTVIHGDGTTTAAKKTGNNIGSSDHKKVEADRVVVFCDSDCNMIAPLVAAAGTSAYDTWQMHGQPAAIESKRHGDEVQLRSWLSGEGTELLKQFVVNWY